MKTMLKYGLLIAAVAHSLAGQTLLAEPVPSRLVREDDRCTAPAHVQGKWIYGSVGPTTYWDSDTGRFLGNAGGSAGIFEFDNAGHYKQYSYLELRTYNVVNKCWTVHEGTVEFTADTFTIRPTKGHYNGEMGSRKIDRDMTKEELEKAVANYTWRIERDDDGNEHFILPFEDGSKFDYRRADTE